MPKNSFHTKNKLYLICLHTGTTDGKELDLNIPETYKIFKQNVII